MLISVVLSFIGRPLVRWLITIHYKKLRIPKGLAAFLTLIVLWIGFISFFRFIIPLLINEVQTLSQIDLEALLKSIEEPVAKFLQFVDGEPTIIQNHTFLDVLSE